MYVKVEPSGCTERKGLVQVRFCMYLDEDDYGYNIHHIQVPERELTKEELADSELAKKVPKVWKNNPFHNHFIYVEPDTTDEEIMDIGEAFLHEAYTKWACGGGLDLKNSPVAFHIPTDGVRKEAIKDKVAHLRKSTLERAI